MMTQAFYTGISGIRSNQYAIDVTSNNIANVSTTGYRGSEYEFASLFEGSLNTSNSLTSSTVGIGTRLQATSLKESQGVLELTDRSTDLAILGNGWFGVEDNGEAIYTRDGAFTFDANDDLVSLSGFHVLGTMGGNVSENDILVTQLDVVSLGDVDAQEKLRFSKDLEYPPEPTTAVSYTGNLAELNDSQSSQTLDAIRTMGAGVVDPQNNKNNLKLTFTPTNPQVQPGIQWDVTATTETLDGTTIYDTQTGQATFDETGALVTSSLTTIDNNGQNINIDLGSGLNGIVSIANSAVYATSTADGTIGGSLEGYEINKNGDVIATFTNGKQSAVGKIGIFHFQNDQGLERLNGSTFRESSNSGKALIYKDENGNNITGTDIVNFRLEGANIDLTYGITELIILQRSFDANSKSITTADQMMQKALSMDA